MITARDLYFNQLDKFKLKTWFILLEIIYSLDIEELNWKTFWNERKPYFFPCYKSFYFKYRKILNSVDNFLDFSFNTYCYENDFNIPPAALWPIMSKLEILKVFERAEKIVKEVQDCIAREIVQNQKYTMISSDYFKPSFIKKTISQ